MKREGDRWLRGFWLLLRPVPVAAWAIGAPVIGLARALGEVGYLHIDWVLVALALLVAIALHGGVSHSANDRADWKSGTDRYSQGILSGGSKVVHRGLLSLGELSGIGFITLVASTILGGYVATRARPWAWLHLSIGIWAALAYSLPPLRLSYRPLVGEWLCAWPALVAACSCTYYIATGRISGLVLLAGGLHGVFCLGWLMVHHISDISADLRAMPRKVTTVAYVTIRWGVEASPWVSAIYFSLSIPLAISLWYYGDLCWWSAMVSAAMALGAATIAAGTNPRSIPDITRRENYLTMITFLHVTWLSLALIGVL